MRATLITGDVHDPLTTSQPTSDLPSSKDYGINRRLADGSVPNASLQEHCWRLSEYTALLIHGLRLAGAVQGVDAVEIGVGSGVVLAALSGMGAGRLAGVDVEEGAVASAAALNPQAELHHGDMWGPFNGRRFDLIAANLPHFPADHMEVAGRRASWSVGGPCGRDLLDKMLCGLPGHMASGGRAVLTHNGFVDLDRSRDLLRHQGMELRILVTNLVHIAADKLACMTPSVRHRFDGTAIHHYGGHAFGEVHVVEVTRQRPT